MYAYSAWHCTSFFTLFLQIGLLPFGGMAEKAGRFNIRSCHICFKEAKHDKEKKRKAYEEKI